MTPGGDFEHKFLRKLSQMPPHWHTGENGWNFPLELTFSLKVSSCFKKLKMYDVNPQHSEECGWGIINCRLGTGDEGQGLWTVASEGSMAEIHRSQIRFPF